MNNSIEIIDAKFHSFKKYLMQTYIGILHVRIYLLYKLQN